MSPERATAGVAHPGCRITLNRISPAAADGSGVDDVGF